MSTAPLTACERRVAACNRPVNVDFVYCLRLAELFSRILSRTLLNSGLWTRISLMTLIRLIVTLLFSALALAAQNLPPGTALPVMLSTSLNAKSVKPGQKIEGKLMQEVMLDAGKLKSGSHVTGHVVSVTQPGASGARIVLQFDQLQNEHQIIPLHVGLRALASSAECLQCRAAGGRQFLD